MNRAPSARRGLWGCAMLVVSGLAGCEEPAAVETAAVETSVAAVGERPASLDPGGLAPSPAAAGAADPSAGESPGVASPSAPSSVDPTPVSPPPTGDALASRESTRPSAAPPTPTAPAATRPPASTPPVGAPPAAAPRKRASRAGEAQEISFDDIKFEMVKGEPFLRTMLTPAIEALTGQRVRLRGYMLPSFQQSGLTQFVLVRDNMECCFGPGAALFDCVVINMVPGRTAEFSVRPVAVEGTFAIKDFLGPDGKHLAIYEMAGEAVR